MRRYFFFIIFFLYAIICNGQKNFNYFIQDLKTTDEFTHWRIPSRVLKSEIKLGIPKVEIESNLNRISDHILSANYYVTEIPHLEIQKISSILEGHKNNIISKDSYYEWFHHMDKEESLSVLGLESKSKITKIVILYHHKFKIQVFEFNTHIDKNKFAKLGWNKSFKRI